MTRVEQARKHEGMTQTELGREAKLSQRDVSRIETGRLVPTKKELERLALALNLTVEELQTPLAVVVGAVSVYQPARTRRTKEQIAAESAEEAAG